MERGMSCKFVMSRIHNCLCIPLLRVGEENLSSACGFHRLKKDNTCAHMHMLYDSRKLLSKHSRLEMITNTKVNKEVHQKLLIH